MNEEQLVDRLEEAKNSNCSIHSEVWNGFNGQLSQLTFNQATHEKEIGALRDNVRELQSLALKIQEQNFKIDKVLESLSDRKLESDTLFKKYRVVEEKLQECPLHKQIITTRFENVEAALNRVRQQEEDYKAEVVDIIEDKIDGVTNGQVLFRWLLSIFLLISMAITGYNIDKTIKIQENMQKITIRIEKMEQRQGYMNDAITHNTNSIAEMGRK